MARGTNVFTSAHIPYQGDGNRLGGGGRVLNGDARREAMAKAAEKRRQVQRTLGSKWHTMYVPRLCFC